MSTELLLRFWFAHNEQLILWLFAMVLVGVTTLTIRAIFAREGESSGGSSIKDLEITIKKILEQAPASSTVSVAATTTSASGDVGDDLVPAPMVAAIREELELKKAELQKTKTDLEARAAEIDSVKKQAEIIEGQLKAATAMAQNSSGGESEQLKIKLKELEVKLAEYAVIEDDIADLSMYKDENAKLKAELEALRGPGVPADPAPGEAAAPSATQIDDPILAEFAAAVAEQNDAKNKKAAAPVEPVAAAIGGDPSIDLDSTKLDTDKMLAEMADLDNVPSVEDVGAHILEAEPDTEKMAAEAGALEEKAS